ncbi:MAG: hypothetical protein GFH27_549323n65 [Chloroflexi bacterium AL-W]|nr:hypothetical protein [Chloroflexi bacterium AL-N1]NOK70216.1 hypothetical protein [Chloroflexi bacterium AL-N10]NOK77753.1 hypothetical protein [Chloroflexi bacterium AL-N5]NOK84762.1 hypothetical protein [Chloroflexi bacterium AL-W]NOK93175.1 hypothetical protein [Chloroflexi bacterium AL-N15]
MIPFYRHWYVLTWLVIFSTFIVVQGVLKAIFPNLGDNFYLYTFVAYSITWPLMAILYFYKGYKLAAYVTRAYKKKLYVSNTFTFLPFVFSDIYSDDEKVLQMKSEQQAILLLIGIVFLSYPVMVFVLVSL